MPGIRRGSCHGGRATAGLECPLAGIPGMARGVPVLQTARSARPLQVLAGLVLGGSLLLSSTVAVAQEAEPPPPPPVSPEWPLVARLQRAIVVRALSNWHHRFDQSAKKLQA